jgi:lipoate---protein ligase
MIDLLFSQGTAQQNMARDHALLQEVERFQKPLLHLYRWSRPSFTFGYFCDPKKYLHMDQVQKHGLSFGRRSTGGGICFHLTDYAFSFLMPSSHPKFFKEPMENYRFVNEKVQAALKKFVGLETELIPASQNGKSSHNFFCSAKATKYDVLFEGKKVGGAAQRQTRGGYLHQGSLFLQEMPWELVGQLLLEGDELCQHMKQTSSFVSSQLKDLEQERDRFEKLLIEQFSPNR